MIDSIIMGAVALWMSAVGWGFLPDPFAQHQRPAQPDPWFVLIGRQFKWLGPLLLAIAIVLAVVEP